MVVNAMEENTYIFIPPLTPLGLGFLLGGGAFYSSPSSLFRRQILFVLGLRSLFPTFVATRLADSLCGENLAIGLVVTVARTLLLAATFFWLLRCGALSSRGFQGSRNIFIDLNRTLFDADGRGIVVFNWSSSISDSASESRSEFAAS